MHSTEPFVEKQKSVGWWQPGSYDSSYVDEGLDCDDMEPDIDAESGCP